MPCSLGPGFVLDINEKEKKNTYKMPERPKNISIGSDIIFKVIGATQVIYFSILLAGILLLSNCHLSEFKESLLRYGF